MEALDEALDTAGATTNSEAGAATMASDETAQNADNAESGQSSLSKESPSRAAQIQPSDEDTQTNTSEESTNKELQAGNPDDGQQKELSSEGSDVSSDEPTASLSTTGDRNRSLSTADDEDGPDSEGEETMDSSEAPSTGSQYAPNKSSEQQETDEGEDQNAESEGEEGEEPGSDEENDEDEEPNPPSSIERTQSDGAATVAPDSAYGYDQGENNADDPPLSRYTASVNQAQNEYRSQYGGKSNPYLTAISNRLTDIAKTKRTPPMTEADEMNDLMQNSSYYVPEKPDADPQGSSGTNELSANQLGQQERSVYEGLNSRIKTAQDAYGDATGGEVNPKFAEASNRISNALKTNSRLGAQEADRISNLTSADQLTPDDRSMMSLRLQRASAANRVHTRVTGQPEPNLQEFSRRITSANNANVRLPPQANAQLSNLENNGLNNVLSRVDYEHNAIPMYETNAADDPRYLNRSTAGPAYDEGQPVTGAGGSEVQAQPNEQDYDGSDETQDFGPEEPEGPPPEYEEPRQTS
jgi:hypothetical protein